MLDLHHPFFTTSIPVNVLAAANIVDAGGTIALILGLGTVPQIDPRIVGGIEILMIEIVGLFAGKHFPNHAMRKMLFSSPTSDLEYPITSHMRPTSNLPRTTANLVIQLTCHNAVFEQ